MIGCPTCWTYELKLRTTHDPRDREEIEIAYLVHAKEHHNVYVDRARPFDDLVVYHNAKEKQN